MQDEGWKRQDSQKQEGQQTKKEVNCSNVPVLIMQKERGEEKRKKTTEDKSYRPASTKKPNAYT